MMGGAGFMAYAKQATENNRSLLKNKRKWEEPPYALFDLRSQKKAKKKRYQFKSYSADFKRKLRSELKRQSRIRTIKSLILLVLSFGLVISGVYFLFWI